MSKITLQSQNAVAETLLIELYARALEARCPAPLVRDDKAIALVRQIDYDFSRFKLRGHHQVTTIMRLREFDRQARDFLARHRQRWSSTSAAVWIRALSGWIMDRWAGTTWTCRKWSICAIEPIIGGQGDGDDLGIIIARLWAPCANKFGHWGRSVKPIHHQDIGGKRCVFPGFDP